MVSPNTSTNITVRQSKSIEDREIGRRFATLWAVLVLKLQEIFDERYAKGTFIVPAFDVRAQILSISNRRNGVEKPVFNLHHLDRNSCSISLLLTCVNQAFLMMCCDRLFVKHVLRLRIVRPLCDGRLFAVSPPGESRPFFSRLPCVVAFSICKLHVSMPDPTRPSALLQGNLSNTVESSVRHVVLLLPHRHLAWQMSIHIDPNTTIQ